MCKKGLMVVVVVPMKRKGQKTIHCRKASAAASLLLNSAEFASVIGAVCACIRL